MPEDHRKMMRPTNLLERVFREVRRRTNPMSCFTNADSCPDYRDLRRLCQNQQALAVAPHPRFYTERLTLPYIETVQFYGNHVMLILNPVQEIQHNHHVMPDLIRHPHGTGIDPESMPNQVEHMVQGDVNAYHLLPQD